MLAISNVLAWLHKNI